MHNGNMIGKKTHSLERKTQHNNNIDKHMGIHISQVK
jgi:hypothetical protein